LSCRYCADFWLTSSLSLDVRRILPPDILTIATVLTSANLESS